jgi:hypothetical protein
MQQPIYNTTISGANHLSCRLGLILLQEVSAERVEKEGRPVVLAVAVAPALESMW